ncbi:diguanylate cyclase [Ketogulonicigenium vulgare]|uniref:diguanylate cyclase n=1 Tax=Ketogulonicigenium vulgare (strain WSH-001) TaxID=759362 RepID=F9Y3E3_KETVW|nr:diguanylate cyclase [Ketogulonicigenium vulgare]ADO42180.1 GGDEF domain protein [Ketogulonicigenium vulgare Y25]AEM40384.1 Diguanylate cyclase response regulator [Ketogulonicigenium vulgare WSH-001]ALJ80571.1 diguanylate cyclase [Ketogulonicigenium vulgare]ANW33391.1 diguanylate cyclase [Ketogulonicigenium vulgare]AOZ54097.1 GGDEF domain protein [Ketogulonicigenium vulgare]
MSGEILVVDADATRRAALGHVLASAHYRIIDAATADEALLHAGTLRPDVILLRLDGGIAQWGALLVRLQALAGPLPAWIIAISDSNAPSERIGALRAGAHDVISGAFPAEVLHAKLRATLRQRDLLRDLQPRDDVEGDTAIGFAEAQAGFSAAGRIAVVSTLLPEDQPQRLRNLLQRWPGRPIYLAPDDLPLDPYVQVPDLFVIDGTDGDARDICRQIAAARGKSATRHTPTLVLLDSGANELAATTLDLGASDQVFTDVSEEELAHRARSLIHSKNRAEKLRNRMRSQLEAAITDQLTGLHNRVYALPRLIRLSQRARDEGRPYSIMMIDIDHFKSVNDSYGHMIGDQVLVGIAQQIRSNLRAIDMTIRFGGEEFLVAMPDTDVEQAMGVAQRLLRKISTTPVRVMLPLLQGEAPDAALDVPITISAGVAAGIPACAVYDTQLTLDEICAAADEALYRAKGMGRNRAIAAQ